MARSHLTSLPIFPIAMVAAAIISLNVFAIGVRLLLPYPINPWEAGIVVEAWRICLGQDPYAIGAEHSTHMYGPLTTYFLAEIFEYLGPGLIAGRLVNTVSATIVVALLASIYGRKNFLVFIVAMALLLAANSRTQYFTETRPDMTACLFGLLFLIFFYRAIESSKGFASVAFALVGSLSLIVGVLFKQTAVAFAFVPLLMALSSRKYWPRIPLSIVPILAIAFLSAAVFYYKPGLWHFMVEVPAQYGVPLRRAASIGWALFLGVPIFLLALMYWLLVDRQGSDDPRIRWLMASMFFAIPSGITAMAKDGGSANSLIPAFLCIGAFCASQAAPALAILQDDDRRLSFRVGAGLLLTALLFGHAYPVLGNLNPSALYAGHGISERSLIVAEVRDLRGKVVSPDDPTIALMAKGYAGRTSVLEFDAVKWDAKRLQPLFREIEAADYVIMMHHAQGADGKTLVSEATSGNMEWWQKEELLREMGFARIDFKSTSTPVYSLWRRPNQP